MLEQWILASALHLAPNRDHAPLAKALSKVVEAQPALFKNDPFKQRTASLLLAIAFREGSLRASIRGDKSKAGNFTSFCTAQINLPFPGQKTAEGWTGDELADDFEKCFTVEERMLRESVKMCPKHPVAFYAEGKDISTCDSSRAQKISNDRMFIAGRLVKEVPWGEDDAAAQPALRPVPAQVHASGLLGSESP